jgi:hypothetical protein
MNGINKTTICFTCTELGFSIKAHKLRLRISIVPIYKLLVTNKVAVSLV